MYVRNQFNMPQVNKFKDQVVHHQELNMINNVQRQWVAKQSKDPTKGPWLRVNPGNKHKFIDKNQNLNRNKCCQNAQVMPKYRWNNEQCQWVEMTLKDPTEEPQYAIDKRYFIRENGDVKLNERFLNVPNVPKYRWSNVQRKWVDIGMEDLIKKPAFIGNRRDFVCQIENMKENKCRRNEERLCANVPAPSTQSKKLESFSLLWCSKFHKRINPGLEQDYTKTFKAGEGGFGEVFYATRNFDNKLVVIKYIQENPLMEQAHWAIRSVYPNVNTIPTEVNAMIELEGVNGAVQLIEAYRNSDQIYALVIETGKHLVRLSDIMDVRGRLTEVDACHYFKQVVETLSTMYKRGRHHFDIKGTNILINATEKKAIVIDFGGAQRVKNEKFSDILGTPKNYPPECYSSSECEAVAFESWTLGLLLFYMTTGIQDHLGIGSYLNSTGFFSPDLLKLIRDCLSRDPQRRPTLQQILNSQWIKRMTYSCSRNN